MYLVMITKKGIIKRTATKDFYTNRKGGLIAIDLDEDDELTWVRLTDGNSELLAATKNGMAIRFNETDVTPRSILMAWRICSIIEASSIETVSCVIFILNFSWLQR